MADFTNVKVDKENMCIDRNSKLGQEFARLSASLEKETDPDKKAFMSQIAAFAEASLVINEMYPGEEGKKKIDQLRKKMES